MGSEDPPPLSSLPEGYHIATCAASGEEAQNIRIETDLAATGYCRNRIVETYLRPLQAWYVCGVAHESRRWDDETV